MEPSNNYELKNLEDLKPNAKNPRRISREDFEALKASIKKFGDLSCVVFNVRTQQLVGGHQRIEAIKTMSPPAKIMILDRLPAPDKYGTVATGKIYIDNEDYKYREVDWDEGFEKAANIAANRIQGDFDLDLLSELNYEISQLENSDELLALSGQTSKEIESLNKRAGIGDDEQPDEIGDDKKDADKLEFRMTREQREVVEEALGNIIATREMATEENGSRNGSALYYLARDYLDKLHGLTETVDATIPAA